MSKHKRVVVCAEYCVGQKLNFQLDFVPEVPGLAEANPRWLFPGQYINYHYTDINGCERYLVGSYWHTQNPTRAWYYDKGDALTVSAGFYCHFENGQTASVFTEGKFAVYRPFLSYFDPKPPFVITNCTRYGFTLLSLGGQDGTGMMQYDCALKSKFSGKANITQLVRADCVRDRDIYPGNDIFSTDGRFDLDTSEWYQGQSSIVPAGEVQAGLGIFQDGPGYQRGDTFTTITEDFKDYIRFQPDGSESIWVTIKRIDWSWNANESEPEWTPMGTVSGPSVHEDSSFPVWTQVVTGVGGTGN